MDAIIQSSEVVASWSLMSSRTKKKHAVIVKAAFTCMKLRETRQGFVISQLLQTPCAWTKSAPVEMNKPIIPPEMEFVRPRDE